MFNSGQVLEFLAGFFIGVSLVGVAFIYGLLYLAKRNAKLHQSSAPPTAPAPPTFQSSTRELVANR
jgi:hypothetical protein